MRSAALSRVSRLIARYRRKSRPRVQPTIRGAGVWISFNYTNGGW